MIGCDLSGQLMHSISASIALTATNYINFEFTLPLYSSDIAKHRDAIVSDLQQHFGKIAAWFFMRKIERKLRQLVPVTKRA